MKCIKVSTEDWEKLRTLANEFKEGEKVPSPERVALVLLRRALHEQLEGKVEIKAQLYELEAMSEKNKYPSFVLPPHINAEPHKRLMERLDKMTREEQFMTLVNAGICDKDGHLRPPYNGEDLQDDASKPTDDSMDNDERARLHAALDEGLAQAAQGQTGLAQEVLAKLKNRA